jgi:hypothetical protein
MRKLVPIRNNQLSEILFFPHIAGSSSWETNFYLINGANYKESVVVEGFNAQGIVAGSYSFDLSAGAVKKVSPSAIGFSTKSVVSMAARTLSGYRSLSGYMKYDYSYNRLWKDCGTTIRAGWIEDSSDTVFIPHIASGNGWYTGVAVMNLGTQEDTLEFTAYDDQGAVIAVSELSLGSYQTSANEVSGYFAGVDFQNIASMMVKAKKGSPITGIAKYITSDLKQLSGIRTFDGNRAESSLLLPFTGNPDDEFLGLGLMNTGSSQDNVVLSLYDNTGALVVNYGVTLAPKQRVATVLDSFFGLFPLSDFEGYIKIDALGGAPLSGMFMTGRNGVLGGGELPY